MDRIEKLRRVQDSYRYVTPTAVYTPQLGLGMAAWEQSFEGTAPPVEPYGEVVEVVSCDAATDARYMSTVMIPPPLDPDGVVIATATAARWLRPKQLVAALTVSEQRAKQEAVEQQMRNQEGMWVQERGSLAPMPEAYRVVTENVSAAAQGYADERGWSVKETYEEDADGKLMMRFEFYESQREGDGPVMGATRTMTSPTSMFHGGLSVHPDLLQEGHGAAFNKAMEDAYRESGIELVQLDARGETGSLGRARQGYDWDEEPSPLSALPVPFNIADFQAAATGALQRLYGPGWKAEPDAKGTIDGFRELLERMRADPSVRPLPHDFAMLGWKRGAGTWFGKELMTGPDAPAWRGFKRIQLA